MVQVSSLMVGGQAHPVHWGGERRKKASDKSARPSHGRAGRLHVSVYTGLSTGHPSTGEG